MHIYIYLRLVNISCIYFASWLCDTALYQFILSPHFRRLQFLCRLTRSKKNNFFKMTIICMIYTVHLKTKVESINGGEWKRNGEY